MYVDRLVKISKRCSTCGMLYLNISKHFYRDKRWKNSFSSKCKECHKKYRQEHREHHHNYMKVWRQQNKEHISEYNRTWHINHREERLLYHKRWAEEHREYAKERHRRYWKYHPGRERRLSEARKRYYRNLEHNRENHRVWVRNNRLLSTIHRLKRNSLKLSLPFNFTVADEKFALEYWNYSCATCGKKLDMTPGNARWAFDHWIPLSDPRPDNPGTVPTNMLPMCHGIGGCNNSKHNTDPIEWLNRIYQENDADLILVCVNIYFQSIKDNEEFNS